MSYYLNSFPITFAYSSAKLPLLHHNSAEERIQHKRELPRACRVVDLNSQHHPLATVCIKAHQIPEGYAERDLAFFEFPHLASRIAEASIYAELARRGFRVRSAGIRTKALTPTPCITRDGLQVRSGITVRIDQPFSDAPEQVFLVANWTTDIEFTSSLADPHIQSLALGRSVLYKPGDSIDEELTEFRNRYIGQVRELRPGDREAVVLCRDKTERRAPLGSLYLEGKPENVRLYDQHYKAKGTPPKLWSEVLKEQFVLNRNGRRNINVLRDQLSAVRELVFGPEKQDNYITSPAPSAIDLVLHSRPIEVEAP